MMENGQIPVRSVSLLRNNCYALIQSCGAEIISSKKELGLNRHKQNEAYSML